MPLFSFLPTRNDRLLRRYKKTVQKIEEQVQQYLPLSDDELRSTFSLLVENAKSDDQLSQHSIICGLALAGIASERTLGLVPYAVQLVGALTLLEGKIAEMRTGEGKTLTAALAAVARAVSNKGVHVITANDYLAQRDANTLRPLFEFLGLSVGVVTPRAEAIDKKAAYNADITYGTNTEIGFDFLRDHMAINPSQQVMRGMHFAMVDEVDSILIDEARTPLIISGPTMDGPDVYQMMDGIAERLVRSEDETNTADFWVDEKNKHVLLGENGMEQAEIWLKQSGHIGNDDSLYAVHNIGLVYHLSAALKAHYLYKKDIAYLIKDGEVQIVDEYTGRAMPGRRWGEGLHQAIEAKEKVRIQEENQTVASITLQNLFRSYTVLSGMTGTADTEAGEFMEIYGLEVVVIPTHRPMVREDANDKVFLTHDAKVRNIVQDIADIHQTGRPILVGTASIETSELIAQELNKIGIKHDVLNAKQHEKEAHIVAQAGTLGTVTIATNMAGRGTDIVLGGALSEMLTAAPSEQHAAIKTQWQADHDQIVALGGLHIVGSERHESRRIDNQLRGRAGRQGDPGSSQFYVSFDDTLLRLFAPKWAKQTLLNMGMNADDAISMPMVAKQIERAQKSVEAYHFDSRKSLLDYDNVANEQRKAFYQRREEILGMSEEDLSKDTKILIDYVVEEGIASVYSQHRYSMNDQALQEALVEWGEQMVLPSQAINLLQVATLAEGMEQGVTNDVLETVSQWVDEKSHTIDGWIGHARESVLSALDIHWREHLGALDTLRKGIHLRGYAQKIPKQEYKKDAFEMFKEMVAMIDRDAVKVLMSILSGKITLTDPKAPVVFAFPSVITVNGLSVRMNVPRIYPVPWKRVKGVLVGTTYNEQPSRVSACHCGSGKAYKYCHGSFAVKQD